MKNKRTVVVATTALFTSVLAVQAAEFQNLDFESVAPGSLPLALEGPMSTAFPGWSGYYQDRAVSVARLDAPTLAGANVCLVFPGRWTDFGRFDPKIIDGTYTALLQSGSDFLEGGRFEATASLAQVGLVPGDALSLQLSIDAHGPFSVFLGGQSLGLVPLQVNPEYTVYGADISSFAGQSQELRITCDYFYGQLGPTEFGNSYLWLDSINFSATPVPEPSFWALLALAATGFFITCRRFTRKPCP